MSRAIDFIFYLGVEHRVGDGREDDGRVYFIGADHGPIKIGRCKGPAESRLKDLQCGSPFLLAILHQQPAYCAQGAERELHSMFGRHRVRGEWFERGPIMRFLRHQGVLDGS